VARNLERPGRVTHIPKVNLRRLAIVLGIAFALVTVSEIHAAGPAAFNSFWSVLGWP